MVSGTKDPTQQALPPTPSSAEEEALKRNTDCVYFLASPLTCKKGSECEYRHSENARLNPRDCWYWLNGNCLNPKCAFRHPPLDGLLGTQVATSAGSSMPPLQIPASSMPPLQSAASPATHTPHNLGKQAVPCIFFQKGLCLKGDRCSFLHGPNPISNKVPQAPAATLVSEPPTLKKAFGGLEKCTQRQKIPQAIVAKPVEVPHEAKPAAKAEAAPPKNGVGIDKYVPPPTSLDVELARYRATIVPPVINGNSVSRPNRMHQAHVLDDHGSQNGKDTDELLRESSPGFDVLVDDELGDSDYYHNEDQFGRTRGHEDRNLNSINEFDIGRSADYNSVADVDREVYRDPRGYDSYDRMQGQYAWEQHRASSERMLMGAAPLERRSFPRAESPDQIVESDLRHRLSKHRRVNGLRSVITHDYAHDNNVEERSYRGSSRRDSHHLPPHESSLSSRLRGRIKLPGRLSPVTGLSPISGSDLRPERERETDRGRNWGRLSPGRPQISSQQGRLQDRIKGRVQEDFNNEGRNFRGPRMRRDIMDDKSTDFAAPKSLAELKVGKYSESKEQEMKGQQSLSIGRQKYLKIEGNQQSEEDLSFEGPKPLSVILKRKRGAETTFSGSGISSDGKEDDTQRESKESLIGSSYYTAVTETQSVPPSASELSIKEESKSASADAVGTVEEDGLIPKLTHGQSSQVSNAREIVTEDGMIVDEAMEDHELEAYDDQRDGDYDYEQVDGEDFNLEEGENADPEEEYLDDEDGDDFAKKIGVMFS